MHDNASYKAAGVDIDEANRFVESLKPLVKTTFRKEVMSGIGGFGGLFHLDPEKYRDPVLVSSTDGVGTKLKIAQEMNRHDTIGIDLVAMSVNDIVVQGAEPLFFLDYLSLGKIDVGRCLEILDGIVRGCQDAGCALIGGETAEMPGFYGHDEYDLAGFCVGIVDADRLLDGSAIRVGDRIIGLASSGLHSNGFSLARHVLFERGGYRLGDRLETLEHTIGDELLTPTRIYVRTVLNLIKNFTVKGIVHITGGGFIDNIPRIIPAASRVILQKGAWPVHPVFSAIQKIGNIVDDEMYRVFNMGIGMMLVVPEKESGEILERLEQMGEKAYLIGQIDKRDPEQPSVVLLPPA
jgi:phosphoribosylformylglycinamidine cyclo-ligase